MIITRNMYKEIKNAHTIMACTKHMSTQTEPSDTYSINSEIIRQNAESETDNVLNMIMTSEQTSSQDDTEQDDTEQDDTEQDDTEQDDTEQDDTEQNTTEHTDEEQQTDDEDSDNQNPKNFKDMIICMIDDTNFKTKQHLKKKQNLKKRKPKDKLERHIHKLTKLEKKHFEKLSTESKKEHVDNYKMITKDNHDFETPVFFKIIDSKMDIQTKNIAVAKYNELKSMNTSDSEYFKLSRWLESLIKIPFGEHKHLSVSKDSSINDIKSFITDVNTKLNTFVYGHDDAKNQIIRIIAQWVSNPQSKGNVIGIHGNPGVGKTTLINDGLSKALNIPFQFIPLGGASDSSYLDGHHYTYEGSTYGKIVSCLMNSKCMNPIIYFDELDKISDTYRGQEIINLLIHLTDPSQNNKFNDKYFAEIPIDLSKALIVFTYNHDELINPILKDRIIRIETKDYNIKDKLVLFKEYLFPSILDQFKIDPYNVNISEESIMYIIEKTEEEKGVRNLKRSIESVISSINLNVLLETTNYSFPIEIKKHMIDEFIKTKSRKNESISHLYI